MYVSPSCAYKVLIPYLSSAHYFGGQLKPHKAASFPKVTPHAPNTIQTPNPDNLTFIGRVKRSLWTLGARLQQQDMKHAFKTGMATAILAAPAFFEATRPVFVEYRGEWALISVCCLCSFPRPDEAN